MQKSPTNHTARTVPHHRVCILHSGHCQMILWKLTKTYATLLHGWAVVIPKEIVNYHWCHSYYLLKGFSPTHNIFHGHSLWQQTKATTATAASASAVTTAVAAAAAVVVIVDERFLSIYSTVKLAEPLSFFHEKSNVYKISSQNLMKGRVVNNNLHIIRLHCIFEKSYRAPNIENSTANTSYSYEMEITFISVYFHVNIYMVVVNLHMLNCSWARWADNRCNYYTLFSMALIVNFIVVDGIVIMSRLLCLHGETEKQAYLNLSWSITAVMKYGCIKNGEKG